MIQEDIVINTWNIYSAEEFDKYFDTGTKWDGEECDEDYIMRHLKEDKRLFRVTFMESARGDQYEEYWKIEEIEQ